ncbi:MAG: methylmalonyl-CoA epimerase [Deltaproteobacteria bacterium]|nr:methylmalonyl-CoA epimerase [Deltaproteobacteria bacterium]
MKKVDHIAIAVSDLEKAKKTFKKLGFSFEETHEVSAMKVETAFAKIGESHIELITPTSKDSTVKKFLQKKGEGIHHICFEVTNIEASIQKMKEKGFQPIYDKPQKGAQGLVTFLHPKETHGVLVELIQRGFGEREHNHE